MREAELGASWFLALSLEAERNGTIARIWRKCRVENKDKLTFVLLFLAENINIIHGNSTNLVLFPELIDYNTYTIVKFVYQDQDDFPSSDDLRLDHKPLHAHSMMMR